MTTKASLQKYIPLLTAPPPAFLGDAFALRFALLPIGAGVGYLGFLQFKRRSETVGHFVGIGHAIVTGGPKPTQLIGESPLPWVAQISIALGRFPAVVAGVTFHDFNQVTGGAGAALENFESDLSGEGDPYSLTNGSTDYQLRVYSTTLRN